ncbi:rhodopsin, G0-coupled-like [Haliotis rubra]|uniref:rhodopsin, G0-coupled-like n=1 Tax=Haliotis rubra TaxID=36100 RepID=UPI001EE56024|nr:rhodopsin, G0-coupled-like [Haliotis rubra]
MKEDIMALNVTDNVDFYRGPLSQRAYFVMGIYMTILGFAAYIGNGLILFLFVKNKLFRQAHINLFIVNIVVCNIGESLLGFPFGVASHFSKRWIFGDIGCRFYGFICFACCLSSMCTYVAISVYRYIAICQPAVLGRLLKGNRIPFVLVMIWAYSLFWAISPFFGWGKYAPEPFKTTCSLAWTDRSLSSVTFIISALILILAIPVTIMVAAYIKILIVTRSQVSGHPLPQEMVQLPTGHANHGVHCIRDIESRTTVIVFLTVALYVVAWAPYAILSFLSVCGVRIPVEATPIPTMFAKSNCAYNPIIYFVSHRRFRTSLMELFGMSPSFDAPVAKETNSVRRT